MLTLADASCYFDRTPVLDADTLAHLFYAQLDLYSDAMRDSATAYRRVMSVKPGTTMPTSRSVSILGARWLVGSMESDGLADPHREKYVLHPAKMQINVSRLSGFLSATVASTYWGDIEWVKDSKSEFETSALLPNYTAYLPQSAALQAYDVVWSGTLAGIVQPAHQSPAGVYEVQFRNLADAVADATLNTRVYDPVVGAYTASTPTTVRCLKMPRESFYLCDSQASPTNGEGDVTLVLPSGTTVATKDTLTFASATWAVLSVQSVGGAVVVHGRRT